MEFLNGLWEVMNSPIGIVVAGAIVAWILKRVWLAKPAWKAYEGTIIAAIKDAEKKIPADDPKGRTRLNAAMRYVLDIYEACGQPSPSVKLRDELREAIGVKHAELEASGNLAKRDGGTRIPVH